MIEYIILPKVEFQKDSQGNEVEHNEQIRWRIYLRERFEKSMKEYAKKGVSVETIIHHANSINHSTIHISNDDLLQNAEYQGFRCACLMQHPIVVANTCNLYIEKTANWLRMQDFLGHKTRNLFIDFFNGYEMYMGREAAMEMAMRAGATGRINVEDYEVVKNNRNWCIE